jgi:hypothetical protein
MLVPLIPCLSEAGDLTGYAKLRFDALGSYGFHSSPRWSKFFLKQLLSYSQNLHLRMLILPLAFTGYPQSERKEGSFNYEWNSPVHPLPEHV